MTEDILRLRGDAGSLNKAMDDAVRAFLNYQKGIDRVKKAQVELEAGSKKYVGQVTAQIGKNKELTVSFERIGTEYKITSQKIVSGSEQQAAAIQRVSALTGELSRKQTLAHRERLAQIRLETADARTIQKKEGTKQSKQATLREEQRTLQANLALERSRVTLKIQEQKAIRDTVQLESEKLKYLALVKRAELAILKIKHQANTAEERAAQLREKTNARLQRNGLAAQRLAQQKAIEEKRSADRAKALLHNKERLALAQARYNTNLEKARAAGQQFLITWKGIARIMLISAGYRAFFAFSSALRQGITNAMEFQRAVAGVRTISQDADLTTRQWADGLQRVSDGWRLDILEQTEAAYQAITNQVAKGVEIFGFLEESNRFATAAFIETNEAVKISTAAMNAFGFSVNDAARIYGSFFKTIELGRLRGGELTEMGRLFLPARTLGIELDELNAAMSTLTIQGVKAKEAMTFLRGIMQKLIRPTDRMVEYFQELGVSSGAGLIQLQGYEGFLRGLEERFAGSSEEIGELFSRVRAMAGIFGQTGSALERYGENLEKIRGSTESYDEAVERMQTSQQKLEVVLSKNRNVFTRFGSDVLDSLSNLTNGFKIFDSVAREVILGLKTLATIAAGAAAAGLTKLIAVIATSPWGLALVGISALVYGIHRMINATERANARFEALTSENIRKYQDSIRERLAAEIQSQVKSEQAIKRYFQNINQAAAAVVSESNRLFNVQNDLVARSDDAVKKITASMSKSIDGMIKDTESGIKTLTDLADKAIDNILKITKSVDDTIFDWELEGKKGADAIDFVRARIERLERDLAQAVDSEKMASIGEEIIALRIRERNLQRSTQEENLRIEEERLKLAGEAEKTTLEYLRARTVLESQTSKNRQEEIERQIELQNLEAEYRAKRTEEIQAQRNLTTLRLQERDYVRELIGDRDRIIAQIEEQAAKERAAAEEKSRLLIEQMAMQERANFLIEQVSRFSAKEIAGLPAELQQRALDQRLESMRALEALGEQLNLDPLQLAAFRDNTEITAEAVRFQMVQEEAKKTQSILLLRQEELELAQKRAKTERETADTQIRALRELLNVTSANLFDEGVEREYRSARIDRELIRALERDRRDFLENWWNPFRDRESFLQKDLYAEPGRQFEQRRDLLNRLSKLEPAALLEQLQDPTVLTNIRLLVASFSELGLDRLGDLGFIFATSEIEDSTSALERYLAASAALAEQERSLLEGQRLLRAIQLDDDPKQTEMTAIEELTDRTIRYKEAVDDAAVSIENLHSLMNRLAPSQAERVRGLVESPIIPENFAHGGRARGRDTIPAMLSPGEMVLNRKASSQFYSQLLGLNTHHGNASSGGGNTTIGDLNINVNSQGNAQVDAIAIGRALQREIRRGTVKL